ncbi:hypothetical protein BDV36DRAFT_302185 [Aspergillus pseudocaelatus]|uniref:Uncharacterized protein n=1 Tax=Aspergillus pseudocaelatus TaxID=1825620 RepID=A0ABQ6W1N4_9EURO|nr:hypothetical protein BDV36DRAFT_302185 [Aspergillus pseudocaelatus]
MTSNDQILSTTYWTLVTLTEQPFLARGHFEFTAIPDVQNESKKKCIEASLEIRDLIEAYRKAFSLRRAQYGISYAMYSAVIVLLQHTDQDYAQFGIEAILPTETFEQGEAWSESWLNVETDDLFLVNDTIFGFFAQE